MSEFDYIAQVFADYADVVEGRKPLLIVSAGKSQFAYDTITKLALASDAVQYRLANLVCEDERAYQHAFVCSWGAPYADEAINLILDAISEAVHPDRDRPLRAIRKSLQVALGMLLGYAAAECIEFADSELGRTCPCDCCGGPETAQDPVNAYTDANPGRFTENAYQY